jgi:hypothetical protein
LKQPFAPSKLRLIFKKSARNPNLIGTNEGITIEYKESFGWASLSDYFRAMAAFANRDGGYIIFGIKDRPHELVGLQGEALERFQSIDNAVWTTNLKECFSPEILWDKTTYDFEGCTYGLIYTYESINKPVICKKDAGELRKAAIYYRYNSQNSEIDYPELFSIIQNEKNKIHEQWMKTIRQIGENGITHTAILDFKSGKLTGTNNTLFIDESLLEEISFVQEGSFVETGGNPALVVKGQVQTVIGAKKIIVQGDREKAINVDSIIKNFIIQENVNAPEEYIKQICYQNTANLPVYYYIALAGLTLEQAISLIESTPIESYVKTKLVERIVSVENKHLPIPNNVTDVANKKREYLEKILEESIDIPTELNELRYFIISIRALTKEQIVSNKDNIFNMLYELYSSYFNNSDYKALKYEMKYAICWIDEALFKNTDGGVVSVN